MKNEEKAEYVLISTSPTFKEDLKKLAYEVSHRFGGGEGGGEKYYYYFNY